MGFYIGIVDNNERGINGIEPDKWNGGHEFAGYIDEAIFKYPKASVYECLDHIYRPKDISKVIDKVSKSDLPNKDLFLKMLWDLEENEDHWIDVSY